MEGVGEWEGRLEVCYIGRWGTVSADGWTETNSRVVCNSLGYDISGEIRFSIPFQGQIILCDRHTDKPATPVTQNGVITYYN